MANVFTSFVNHAKEEQQQPNGSACAEPLGSPAPLAGLWDSSVSRRVFVSAVVLKPPFLLVAPPLPHPPKAGEGLRCACLRVFGTGAILCLNWPLAMPNLEPGAGLLRGVLGSTTPVLLQTRAAAFYKGPPRE